LTNTAGDVKDLSYENKHDGRVDMSPCNHTEECRFSPEEAKNIHSLADILENGGLENIRYLVQLGESMRTFRKAACIAAAGILVAGVARLIWEGFKMALGMGK
jgi:hypothetical protein